MRKITAGLFVSLDGVAESPSTWAYQHFGDEVARAIDEGVDRPSTSCRPRWSGPSGVPRA